MQSVEGSSGEMAIASDVVQCPRHPTIETALRCSRCDTPICPRCMVQSPVGARCPDCAQTMRAPMYLLKPLDYAKALAVALIGGVLMGFAWGFVGAAFSRGFFLIFVGFGLGWAFTKMMEFATRGKRGPIIVGFAIAGVLVAWGMQFYFVPTQVAQLQLIAVAVAAYMAYQYLK